MAHLQHRRLAGTLVVYDYTLANLQNDTEFLEFAEDVKFVTSCHCNNIFLDFFPLSIVLVLQIKQYHFQDLETPSQGNLKFIRTRLR